MNHNQVSVSSKIWKFMTHVQMIKTYSTWGLSLYRFMFIFWGTRGSDLSSRLALSFPLINSLAQEIWWFWGPKSCDGDGDFRVHSGHGIISILTLTSKFLINGISVVSKPSCFYLIKHSYGRLKPQVKIRIAASDVHPPQISNLISNPT